MAHPYVNVSGVNFPTECDLMIGHGRAIYAYVKCLPQASLPNITNITLTVSDGLLTLTLTGCLIDKARIDWTMDGHIEGIVVLGRVWRWKYGIIDGVYNLRNPDGTIKSGTEKTPRELATLLFNALGEPVHDVSNLPNDSRPFVNWQCADAWPELRKLIRTLGCTTGINLFSNAPQIWQIGHGAALLGGSEVQTTSFGVDWGDPPDNLVGCVGPTRVQSKLELEPVVLDTDNTIKTLDAVSYKPASGWKGKDPFDPLDTDATDEEKQLARLTYLKWWRVKNQADGTLNVPGLGNVGSIEQILPLRDTLIETYDSGYGEFELPAFLDGTIAIETEALTFENTEPHTVIDVGWQLQAETGIVITEVPLFKVDESTGEFEAADVFFTTSYNVMQSTWNYHQYKLTLPVASNGTPDLAVRRPDLQLDIVAHYQADGETVGSVTDNQPTLDGELENELEGRAQEWVSQTAEVRQYRALMVQTIDGAVNQIKIRVSKDTGFNMWIARNTEWLPGLPTRLEQVRNDATDRIIAQQEFVDAQRRRLARKRRVD